MQMQLSSRRALLGSAAAILSLTLAGCNVATKPEVQPGAPPPRRGNPKKPEGGKPAAPDARAEPSIDETRYQSLYSGIPGEKFPVNAIGRGVISPDFWRTDVAYFTTEPAGTIIIDPAAHHLYYVLGGGKAMRYGVGVGKEGFAWSGVATINSKQEWPDWYPPTEMIERTPDLKARTQKLQSGIGVAGGTHNPLGARAMYLWQNNKDTLFRIHGTLEPGSIGKSVSSGCIRMANQDVIDLYQRVAIGTKVVVTGNAVPANQKPQKPEPATRVNASVRRGARGRPAPPAPEPSPFFQLPDFFRRV